MSDGLLPRTTRSDKIDHRVSPTRLLSNDAFLRSHRFNRPFKASDLAAL